MQNKLTDQELLVIAAAKAIGVYGTYENGIIWHKNQFGDDVGFNPLKDDGCALRLAVKLRIDVCQYQLSTDALFPGKAHITEMHSGDPCAATRSAIVRAAAEIGKAMT